MRIRSLILFGALGLPPLAAQEAAENKLKRLESEVDDLKWELDQVRKLA